jgi:hypothetical protein
MAKENFCWGYDRIVGALANLGHTVSDQTVGNILRRHGVPPAPERKHTTSWSAFIRAHLAVLAAYAERWIRSAKDDCLSKLILLGERSLRRALSEYVQHYHAERNHQGRCNVLLFPRLAVGHRARRVQCRERLGGLLRYYHREAA